MKANSDWFRGCLEAGLIFSLCNNFLKAKKLRKLDECPDEEFTVAVNT
jgi:hypothetical protein